MEWPGCQEMVFRYLAVWNLILFHEFWWRFNSSENIKCFFRNLKWFQTLPWVWSQTQSSTLGIWWNLNVFNTSPAWRPGSVTGVSEDIQKNYHRNLPRAFAVCSQMPSNSENRFGLVVDKFSELGHIWILNRGDGYQVLITLAQQSEILLRLFLLWHTEIKISKQISNFLKRIQWKFLKNNWTWISDCRVSCSLKIFTRCNKVLKHGI